MSPGQWLPSASVARRSSSGSSVMKMAPKMEPRMRAQAADDDHAQVVDGHA